jgi:hypothetical protein
MRVMPLFLIAIYHRHQHRLAAQSGYAAPSAPSLAYPSQHRTSTAFSGTAFNPPTLHGSHHVHSVLDSAPEPRRPGLSQASGRLTLVLNHATPAHRSLP